MKFDVCLEAFFADLPYEQRIPKIAQAGYDTVEFWFHDSTAGNNPAASAPKDAATLKQVCEQNGITINNMVVNSPDGGFGGALTDANDLPKYIDRMHEVIAFCKAAGIPKAITCTGNLQPGLTREQMRANVEKALSEGAKIAEQSGFTLVLEPLNTYVDHAGYFLDSSIEGAEIVRAIDSPSLKLLYDVYHMQIMEGNVIANIEKNIDVIGHFHSAGVPGRGELTNGELNYAEIIRRITATGYDASFGLEYFPTYDDMQSLVDVRKLIDSAL